MKQLSIFIENKGGTLIRVLDLLSKAGIQIIASTVSDTQDFGIYRVLCNQPQAAFLMLKEAGINVQLTDVFAISIDDQPGRAAQAVEQISKAGVSILYLYSFLWKGKGVLVFRVDKQDVALSTIHTADMTQLTTTDFA